MKIPKPIVFDWDKGNTDKNLHKHNVSNRETEEIFNDEFLKIFGDIRHSYKEQRFVAYGATNLNRKLTIVFTVRKQKIRIISARDQNKKERIIYEESI
ncbi:BrnT family toxin [Patescibacteria group bacterium]|nr:BrnT family toxin [Patescibacteria group bacterium]